jgi:aminopeptidase
MEGILDKYARLLVDYCLEIKKGERVFIRTSMLAEPLLRRVVKEIWERGAQVEYNMQMQGMAKTMFSVSDDEQLQKISPFQKMAMEEFDAFLVIRAPYNLREDQGIDPAKLKKRSEATKALNKVYFERTGNGSLKRSLCQFPTQASAQEAGMSLEEYQHFVFNACKLYEEDPRAAWLEVRKEQQRIVDYLNQCDKIEYKGPNIDISFSTKGRTWINSDGRNNMPSGEVFSAPIEDSVNGKVTFTYPCVFRGKDVVGATLEVKDGLITSWDAQQGKEILDEIFQIDGARRWGEVAIGTNYAIQQSTRNILFDEKIGGTIHMAVGQSYKQCGGKNESAIHWDMITDMTKGGYIVADGKEIYRDGEFLV